MLIENINKSQTLRFRNLLDSLSKSFSKRGVSFIVTASSETSGNILMQVSGHGGVASKNIYVYYNESNLEYVALCDDKRYFLSDITEISTIIKSKVQQLSTIVNRF